jgi:hypothetical protein
MTRLSSRAASTQEPKDDARVTEIINWVLVSKPVKKGPVVIDLQEYSRSGKAASVRSINKLRVIHNFISSNGRV